MNLSNWDNIPSRLFMKMYKKLSDSNKTKAIIILDYLNLLSLSIRERVEHRGSFQVRVKGAKKFKVINYGGEIEREIFKNGLLSKWEKDVIWIWMDLCKISQVVFDIGANTGFYSLIAKSVNIQTEVYAFEPSPRTFEKLVRNVCLNKYNIKCERNAISNKSGKGIFYDTPDKNELAASLSPEKLKNAPWYKGSVLEYEVPTKRLSDYIEQNDVEKISLIKMDIEMHETEALEGMGEYLEIFHPIIIIEVLTEQMAEKLNSFFNLSDYRIFHLKKSRKAELTSKFKLFDSAYETREWNFLVFHKQIEEKVRKGTCLYNNLL